MGVLDTGPERAATFCDPEDKLLVGTFSREWKRSIKA